MTSRPSRHPLLRTGAFGAAALALVVVACDSSKLPTSAEVERMDASQATARVMAVSSASGPIAYFVDGAPVSDTRARALPADSIGSMQVERRVIDGVEGSTVRITTRAARVASGAVPVASGAPQTERVVVRRMPDGRADTSRVVAFLNGQQAPITGTARFSATGDTAVIVQTSGGPAPTYYIDGVKADASALKTLAPDRIASVEILKGDAARAQYGADGANGVIRITTKKTR
jgi:TonB-dependent SusC/RagA subfamily outer membrane receptor